MHVCLKEKTVLNEIHTPKGSFGYASILVSVTFICTSNHIGVQKVHHLWPSGIIAFKVVRD